MLRLRSGLHAAATGATARRSATALGASARVLYTRRCAASATATATAFALADRGFASRAATAAVAKAATAPTARPGVARITACAAAIRGLAVSRGVAGASAVTAAFPRTGAPFAVRGAVPLLSRGLVRRMMSTTATAAPNSTTATSSAAATTTGGAGGSSGSGSGNSGDDGSGAVSKWLFAVAGMVFAMIVLGGLTRLTRSGLSMVEWKFHGEHWPQNESEWLSTFEGYKQFPEFQKVNRDMTVEEFKFIYFMEYAHRMLGRVIGGAFVLPLIGFGVAGKLPRRFVPVLALLLAMGTTQGFVGWWMVRSGLQQPEQYKTPRVSPYRLTFHLLMAIATYAILFTSALRLRPAFAAVKAAATAVNAITAPTAFRRAVVATGGVLGVTVVSGAFVAGNQAGLVYNEWPLMGGRFVPQDLTDPTLQPAYRNFFEHSTRVQFQHRLLAYASFASVAGLWHWGRRLLKRGALPAHANAPLNALFAIACAQVALGITTLVTLVPVSLGSAHQAGAISLLTSALWLHERLRRAGPAAPARRVAAAAAGVGALGLVGVVGPTAAAHFEPHPTQLRAPKRRSLLRYGAAAASDA